MRLPTSQLSCVCVCGGLCCIFEHEDHHTRCYHKTGTVTGSFFFGLRYYAAEQIFGPLQAVDPTGTGTADRAPRPPVLCTLQFDSCTRRASSLLPRRRRSRPCHAHGPCRPCSRQPLQFSKFSLPLCTDYITSAYRLVVLCSVTCTAFFTKVRCTHVASCHQKLHTHGATLSRTSNVQLSSCQQRNKAQWSIGSRLARGVCICGLHQAGAK